MTHNYEFANVTFKINTVYKYFHDFAKEYITNKKEKECIKISSKDINVWIKEHKIDTSKFPLEYIETLVVHSKLADILCKYNIFIFHGSAIYVDSLDNAYIFTAKSGVGKSTHVNLLMKNYPNRVNYINDDKPFISIEKDSIYVYGSPFDGKERRSSNVKSKLKGIFILSRNKTNIVHPLKSVDALKTITNQLHFPKGSKEKKATYDFLFKLIKSLPFYDLKVNMLDEASKISFKIMDK